MLIKHLNTTFNLIGDPHLGRQFFNGVPLHRKSHREAMVWDEFSKQLTIEADFTIIMGDLFDKYIVPPEVVLRVFNELYLRNGEIYIIRGNHDGSRDADKASSFDLLEALLSDRYTTFIVKDECLINELHKFIICPWHPFKTAVEILPSSGSYEGYVAFGHWDVTCFGDDVPHNMIPYKELTSLGITTAYTGHDHTPCKKNFGSLEVIVTGSLQPYSHGEDPDGKFYVTLTLDELMLNPEAYKDKCLRVRLREGETPPEVDCLQLTWTKIQSIQDGVEDAPVTISDFNLHELFMKCMADAGVETSTSATLWEELATC